MAKPESSKGNAGSTAPARSAKSWHQLAYFRGTFSNRMWNVDTEFDMIVAFRQYQQSQNYRQSNHCWCRALHIWRIDRS